MQTVSESQHAMIRPAAVTRPRRGSVDSFSSFHRRDVVNYDVGTTTQAVAEGNHNTEVVTPPIPPNVENKNSKGNNVRVTSAFQKHNGGQNDGIDENSSNNNNNNVWSSTLFSYARKPPMQLEADDVATVVTGRNILPRSHGASAQHNGTEVEDVPLAAAAAVTMATNGTSTTPSEGRGGGNINNISNNNVSMDNLSRDDAWFQNVYASRLEQQQQQQYENGATGTHGDDKRRSSIDADGDVIVAPARIPRESDQMQRSFSNDGASAPLVSQPQPSARDSLRDSTASASGMSTHIKYIAAAPNGSSTTAAAAGMPDVFAPRAVATPRGALPPPSPSIALRARQAAAVATALPPTPTAAAATTGTAAIPVPTPRAVILPTAAAAATSTAARQNAPSTDSLSARPHPSQQQQQQQQQQREMNAGRVPAKHLRPQQQQQSIENGVTTPSNSARSGDSKQVAYQAAPGSNSTAAVADVKASAKEEPKVLSLRRRPDITGMQADIPVAHGASFNSPLQQQPRSRITPASSSSSSPDNTLDHTRTHSDKHHGHPPSYPHQQQQQQHSSNKKRGGGSYVPSDAKHPAPAASQQQGKYSPGGHPTASNGVPTRHFYHPEVNSGYAALCVQEGSQSGEGEAGGPYVHPATMKISTTTLTATERKVRYLHLDETFDPDASDPTDVDGQVHPQDTALLKSNPTRFAQAVIASSAYQPTSAGLITMPMRENELSDNDKDSHHAASSGVGGVTTAGAALTSGSHAPTYLLNDGRRWVRRSNRPTVATTADPRGHKLTFLPLPTPPHNSAVAEEEQHHHPRVTDRSKHRRDSREYGAAVPAFPAHRVVNSQSGRDTTGYLLQRHVQQAAVGPGILKYTSPQSRPPPHPNTNHAPKSSSPSRAVCPPPQQQQQQMQQQQPGRPLHRPPLSPSLTSSADSSRATSPSQQMQQHSTVPSGSRRSSGIGAATPSTATTPGVAAGTPLSSHAKRGSGAAVKTPLANVSQVSPHLSKRPSLVPSISTYTPSPQQQSASKVNAPLINGMIKAVVHPLPSVRGQFTALPERSSSAAPPPPAAPSPMDMYTQKRYPLSAEPTPMAHNKHYSSPSTQSAHNNHSVERPSISNDYKTYSSVSNSRRPSGNGSSGTPNVGSSKTQKNVMLALSPSTLVPAAASPVPGISSEKIARTPFSSTPSSAKKAAAAAAASVPTPTKSGGSNIRDASKANSSTASIPSERQVLGTHQPLVSILQAYRSYPTEGGTQPRQQQQQPPPQEQQCHRYAAEPTPSQSTINSTPRQSCPPTAARGDAAVELSTSPSTLRYPAMEEEDAPTNMDDTTYQHMHINRPIHTTAHSPPVAEGIDNKEQQHPQWQRQQVQPSPSIRPQHSLGAAPSCAETVAAPIQNLTSSENDDDGGSERAAAYPTEAPAQARYPHQEMGDVNDYHNVPELEEGEGDDEEDGDMADDATAPAAYSAGSEDDDPPTILKCVEPQVFVIDGVVYERTKSGVCDEDGTEAGLAETDMGTPSDRHYELEGLSQLQQQQRQQQQQQPPSQGDADGSAGQPFDDDDEL